MDPLFLFGDYWFLCSVCGLLVPVFLYRDYWFLGSVGRLLVPLFLSGGLTAVLSVSLLASKRLQPCKIDL